MDRNEREAVQFGVERVVALGMNDCNLPRLQHLPLADQMPKHRRFTPRQKQFWSAHARRCARREDYDAANEVGCFTPDA